MKPIEQAYKDGIDALLSRAQATQTGLTSEEAARRQAESGKNKLPEAGQESIVKVFFRQFLNPLIYILIAAAAIIFFLGEMRDAFIISGVLLFNAIIGTVQEGRTRNILASLQKFITSDSVVLRDGEHVVLPDEQLVVGDIIILQEGGKIPADARVIEASNLVVNESLLTGESTGVTKTIEPVTEEVPVFEQINMLFRGTYIVSGFGKAIVTAIGADTEVGKLNKSIKSIHTDMPIKRELDRLSRWILLFIAIMCVILFVIGILTGKPLTELLVMLTALFICVIPEGLPVVLTLVLVSGAYRMAKKNVLVKRLAAVEALGRVDTILIDKTGTLTRNEMMVCQVYSDGKQYTVSGEGYKPEGTITCGEQALTEEDTERLKRLAQASILARAEINYDADTKLFRIKGDPTEASFTIFAQKYGMTREQLEEHFSVISSIPFGSETRYSAGFYRNEGEEVAFVDGSPEIVMDLCSNVTEQDRAELARMLEEGLRMIGVAYKVVDKKDSYGAEDLAGMTFVGLLGIQDAIRAGAADSVAEAHEQNIWVAMVTGDHQDTAEYVARETGILQPDTQVTVGKDFEALDKKGRLERARVTTVYARVSPHQKLEIVNTYHELHDIVAMTGDGVNDAPPLAAADVGIAMGSIGTEVAKEAADVILLDDAFSSIMAGVREGRHIFYALRRVVLYFFATNLGEVLVVLFALIANLPLPILPAQILWLNVVTDGFLDVALAMEPHEPGIDKYLNYTTARLVNRNLGLKVLFMAIPMGIGSIIMFLSTYSVDLPKARTITLVTMAMFQWFNAWNCRSEYKSILQIGIFSNYWLLIATAFVALLQVLVVYNPLLQAIFYTVPLSLYEWVLILLVSSSILWLDESRKLVVRLISRRVDEQTVKR